MLFRFAKPLLVLAVTLLALVSSAAAAESPVGYTQITVAGDTALRGDPSGRLNVVVWYPAVNGTRTSTIEVGPPGRAYFAEGEAALDAPIAASPATFPFVVVSHGTGGTSMDLSWLCASLASHGYIVASVEHPGNNALHPPTVAGTTLWWQRAVDLSRTIDGMLAASAFTSRIDRARIGAAGFSLGGYTVLAVAGARASTKQLDAFCTRNTHAAMCSGEATPDIPDIAERSAALAQTDKAFREALDGNAAAQPDPRVAAVFSIAPALGPAILKESLAEVKVPVALVAGLGDPIVPVTENIIPDALAIPDAEVTLFPKSAGHYTFLTDCTPLGAKVFAPICGDAGPRRVALHRATAALALAFFNRTLNTPAHADR